MDELKKNVEKILNQFYMENVGNPEIFGVANRLSQFAMISLKNVILMEIDKQINPEKGEK